MWFWKVIGKLIRPYSGYVLLTIISSFLSIVFSLFSITMIIPFLDLLFQDELRVESRPELIADPEVLNAFFRYYLSQLIDIYGKAGALWNVSLVVVALFFLKNLFRFLANYFMAPLRAKVLRNLRNQLYEKITALPLSFYGKGKAGDMLSRVSSDVQEVEWSVMSFLIMLFRQPMALIIFLGALIIISPELTLFALILIPLAGLLVSQTTRWLNKLAVKGQEQMSGLVSILEESLGGIRIIKAFNAIDHSDARFRSQNQEYTNLLTRVYRRRDLGVPLSETLSILAMVSVIWFGGRQVLDPTHPLQANMFLLYLTIFSQVIPPAKSLISAYYYIQKGSASMERIQEVLDASDCIPEQSDAVPIREFRKALEVEGLYFAYDSEAVLENIRLHIHKGESLAIVGPSGSGKSTLLNLLPRFYDPQQGEIKIDGTDIRHFRLSDLRNLMGLVSQDTILFNASVMENIRFGLNEAGDEEVREAARLAQAEAFILTLPEGFDTHIGDRGLKLSGGQKQRLALARAILRNPPILLLDEATSALDNQSEREVQDALQSVMRERTSIVVAHRLSTIRQADRILVMESGRIREEGKHAELMEKKGLYYRLWMMQHEE